MAELTWQVGQRHSTELLERLEWLLAASRLSMGDLTGVAVALGPGSFNGVRVALATAKSLAFARGVPLYGVPTLDIIAWGHRLIGGTICAILEADAGRSTPRSTTRPSPTPPAGSQCWLSGVDSRRTCCADSVVRRFSAARCRPRRARRWREALGGRFRATSALDERRAGWLAELALARSAAQRYDDPMALEPLYLRRPAITTSARRRLPTPAEDADEAAGMASNAIIATQQGSATMRREEENSRCATS